MLLKLIDFPCMLSTMLIPNPEVQSLYHVATYVFDNIFKLESCKNKISHKFTEYDCDHQQLV